MVDVSVETTDQPSNKKTFIIEPAKPHASLPFEQLQHELPLPQKPHPRRHDPHHPSQQPRRHEPLRRTRRPAAGTATSAVKKQELCRTSSGQIYVKGGLRPLPRLHADEVARLLSPFLGDDEEEDEVILGGEIKREAGADEMGSGGDVGGRADLSVNGVGANDPGRRLTNEASFKVR